MIRKAFKMKLFPGKLQEYIVRHNPIWEELEILLKEQGVSNYSIFFDEDTDILFAYVELESMEKWEAIAKTEVCKIWWVSLISIMDTNPDNSPSVTYLKEVFHID
ncbi:L-rhamnose mutarotase [Nonlabens xiamenensis]|uniref:L-rhamnose mutarotase n=1 Tax=Nonlabens xiamenensis TaxID=2341043 RepID=UPI000F60BF0F|nr:L-rhamnose mutarotase [Nonlabens xiamenensis]